MSDGKIKSPYHGIVLSCLLICGVSSLMYWFMYAVLNKFQTSFPHELVVYSAMILGFGIGSIFNITCIIVGLLNDSFNAVIYRVSNFISNLKISLKFARICYISDLKERGVAFWIYFAVIGGYLVLFFVGLFKFFECATVYF